MRVLLIGQNGATPASVKAMLIKEKFVCDTADFSLDGLEIGSLDYDVAARTRVSRRRGGEDIRVNFSCCHRELIASRFELINFMELIGESMRIGEQPAELAQLKALLAPCPTGDMVCWPVSPRVGNVKNNDPPLIEPVIYGFLVMIVTA